MVVSGAALFNFFIINLDKGIECTLSKNTDNTKLEGVLDTLEVRVRTLRDFSKLEN